MDTNDTEQTPVNNDTGSLTETDNSSVTESSTTTDNSAVNPEPVQAEASTKESSVEDTSVEDTSEEESTATEDTAVEAGDRVDTSDGAVTETLEDLSVEDEAEAKKKGNWKIFLGVLILLVAAVYGAGVYYYSSHFPHAIMVNGQKLGEKSISDAEKVFTEDLNSHSITLKERNDQQEVINASDMGTKIDVGNRIRELHDSLNPWLWFTNMFGKKDNTIRLDVSYDETAMTQTIDALNCFKEENIVAPKSCYIQAGETQFEIVPEEIGTTVIKEDLTNTIKNCLSTCVTSIDLDQSNLYQNPKYYSTDEVVVKALETANTYTKGTITHDFTYATETIDYNTTKKWIKISKDFKVTLDKSAVGDYVVSLGTKYNTMGGSHKFTTAYGKKTRVADGDYGWRIDFKKEKKQLIKDIESGETINRKPIYSYTAAVQSKDDDIGDSYVEVSISRQELWLFVDGECILSSSVVTGGPEHGTDKGVYSITYKKRDDYLEGYNSDGTTYRSHVEYWMPFNGNQGLHDASWRDEFGGKIYKTNGSHGCVNCPTSTAATLYKYVKEGFPVIIY